MIGAAVMNSIPMKKSVPAEYIGGVLPGISGTAAAVIPAIEARWIRLPVCDPKLSFYLCCSSYDPFPTH